MNLRKLLILSLLMTVASLVSSQSRIIRLTTDYRTNPLGIDNPRPRLSWIITSEQMNTMQEAYQIRAAVSEKDLLKGRNLVWESGEIATPASIHVRYGGPPLKSFQRICWQVRIRDNHGKSSKWSEVAWFETGFMPGTDWKAGWIAPAWEEDPRRSMPSPYLRKEFIAAKEISEARLYISSHGLYQAEINGKRVGDRQFTPGWTSYNKRLQYQVYDVSALLQKGNNAIGIVLGDGWYRGFLAWEENRNAWGRELSAIAQVMITYADGSREVVVTDESWKAATGPILESDIYNGELYDARKEEAGWSRTGFDDSGWTGVKAAGESLGKLIATEGPPVRITEELEPVSISKRDEGWLVDMGQNMVGWIRIRAAGTAGDRIILRHAEVLDREGNMYYDNLRVARATDTYILKGGGEETLEPHFTFHGFRYVMVSGYPGELTADRIRGMVIHSDMEPAGTFTCSDPLVNQLQHNILWGLKGNFLDVPTDCPQRDERLGWTGDAQVFAPTACFNMNAATFYRKWLKDLAADQREDGRVPDVIPNMLRGGGCTGWSDASVIIPWVVYLDYGDVSVLENQYESMKKWIGYMEQHAGEDLVWQERDYHYGDWLSFDDSRSDYMGAYTAKDLIATAYFSYSASIVGKAAGVLGRVEDETYYTGLSERIKDAFNREYVTPNGRLVSHTQTAYTLALAFDMLDRETAAKAAAFLAGDVEQFGHITTGFLGTPQISFVLTSTGRIDLAYLLLMRKEYPSWLYPVTMGATTIWERWDGQKPDSTFQDPGMNSFNHYAYGAIGKWLYQVVAGIGIDEDQPGYRHVIIHPRPGGGLDHARATHESMYGTIASGWVKAGKTLTMEVEIPVNTHATLIVPGMASDIWINGIALEETEMEYSCMEGEVGIETGSGRYTILTRMDDGDE